jgi:hypothetical protein
VVKAVRDALARGGLVGLGVVFALAFALWGLAGSVAQVLVTALAQQTAHDRLQFHVRHTRVDVTDVLFSAVALVLLAVALLALLRKGARFYRTCPECLSDIPHDATVCRYCTADLGRPETS